jgi:hypothetical protein
MAEWIKSFSDKISERSLLSLVVLILGVILLLIGAADGFAVSKFSITIKDYYLKLCIIFIGICFVVTAICSLLREAKSSRKDLNEMKILFNQLEEKFNNAFKDSKGEEEGKWKIYIENVLNQRKNDDVAFCILRRQLNSDAKPSKPDIMQAFSNASSLVRTEIFWLIKQYRENMVYKLLVNNALEENKIKESISHLVLLL